MSSVESGLRPAGVRVAGSDHWSGAGPVYQLYIAGRPPPAGRPVNEVPHSAVQYMLAGQSRNSVVARWWGCQ